MKKNILFSLTLGIGVSVAGLYLAFRNVPFSELIIYLASIDYFWIFPAVLAGLISFTLRVLRWQIILESAQKINFWGAFHPLMIGFMLNCMLPGRAGEVARPVILQKKNNVPFSTGLATVAAERVFDIIILITFFSVAFATVEIDPDLNIPFGDYNLNRGTLEMIGGGMLKLTVVLITGMIMVSFSATRRIINGGIMGIPSLFFFAGSSFKIKIKDKVCSTLVGFMENFASGFALVRSPKKIGICIGLSVLIWGLQAFSYYVFSLGCPGIGHLIHEDNHGHAHHLSFYSPSVCSGILGTLGGRGDFRAVSFRGSFKRRCRLYAGKSCYPGISCHYRRLCVSHDNRCEYLADFI